MVQFSKDLELYILGNLALIYKFNMKTNDLPYIYNFLLT